MNNEKWARKYIFLSKQNKVSILPYFLRIGNTAADRMDIYLSQRLYTLIRNIGFKNNKTINQIFEDKQKRKRERQNLSRVAVVPQ